MIRDVQKWIRRHYNKIVNSIAFYPALIAIGFLLLSWGMLQLDVSDGGKHLKGTWKWISLQDASTARSIVSTIVAGLISLTVFSFSMVMIVLNQAASQMSNRVLNSMIENRTQQIILGVYIGAIVYGLFLLSTIRDTDNGIYVPAFSIYLLIFITIIIIFLFIYFLDYVTQTVKFETVISRVQTKTLASLKQHLVKPHELSDKKIDFPAEQCVVYCEEDGYFQGVNTEELLAFAKKEKVVIASLHKAGTFLLTHTPLFKIFGRKTLDDEARKQLLSYADFYDGQPVDQNPEYGFQHLTEVAVKALSPGINDPATAVLSLNALGSLLLFRAKHDTPIQVCDDSGDVRLIKKMNPFECLLEKSLYPIWQYGKDDFITKEAFRHLLGQLLTDDIPLVHSQAIKNFMKRHNISFLPPGNASLCDG